MQFSDWNPWSNSEAGFMSSSYEDGTEVHVVDTPTSS